MFQLVLSNVFGTLATMQTFFNIILKSTAAIISSAALLFTGAPSPAAQQPPQPASAIVAVAPIAHDSGSMVSASPPASSTTAASDPAPASVLPKKRTAPTSTFAPQPGAVAASPNIAASISKSYIDEQLQILRNSLSSEIFKYSSAQFPNSPGISQYTANLAVSQRIDQLSGTRLSNITVSGVSGLTAADIPTDITVSNYLPLTGGALSDNLTVAGNVGIGTTSPMDKLTIVGRLNIDEGSLRGFTLSSRDALTTFPVPSFRPTATNAVLALDIMPNGNPVESGGNGYAWIDVCDTDILNGSGAPVTCARIGARSVAMEFGSKSFFGADRKPIYFTVGSASPSMVIATSSYVAIGSNVLNPETILTVAASSTDPSYATQLSLRSARAAVISGNLIGGVDFRSNDTNLTAPGIVVASIKALANTTHTASALGSDIAFSATTGTTFSELMRLTGAGFLGIGSTTPWRKLGVTGTVGFDGLTGSTGAGSLCLSTNKEVVYNSGSDSCLSSTRITKHDIVALGVSGSAAINALQPVSFVYNNDASSTVRYGFIAEDAAAVDAHLATYDAAGAISGIDDRSIISILVKAIQELLAQVNALASVVAGFAHELVTDRVVTKELCVSKSDGTLVCVTGDQLATIGSTNSISSTSATSTPDTTPPVITINGANPAQLQIGGTYNDLGAAVTDDVDQNLGVHAFVDSTPLEQAFLDTSAATTYHIDYVATDTTGNTATSTRTVIVGE